jgi:4'-phosphopantetheinyl transferase
MDKCNGFFSLPHGVVAVWVADLGQLTLDSERCYQVLDATERAKVAALKSPLLRERYVQAHALLRGLLGRYVQAQPESLSIQRSAYGKPFLADYAGLSFNMSHSANKLLIAITATVPVGVDIEEIKPRTHTAGLVAKCFAPEEQTYWQALPEAEQTGGFFDFWTRKEAFVKAVGQGIRLGLDQCVVDPLNPCCFLRIPAMCGSVADWQITALDVDVSCRAAVVARLPVFSVNTLLLADYVAWLV